MKHNLFKPTSFSDGQEAVVGSCNGFTMKERWEKETPLFAQEIVKYVPQYGIVVDYGCGVGRLAKGIINLRKDFLIIGVDESEHMRDEAERYVKSDGNGLTFLTSSPEKLHTFINEYGGFADLIYCVYVLQHVPALYIREILARISYNLKDDGKFIYCSSDYRMCIRFDNGGFFDDRFLGVNLQEEIDRFFVKEKPLFDDATLNANPILGKMIRGDGGGLPHPAFVYRKK